MSGLIPNEIIDRILGQADIVEVVSSYVPLKRSGRNFKALCPFHDEKTPSFMVHQEKGIFKCFGCGKGGNAIHFVMEREHLSYPEAIRALGERYGIAVPESRQGRDERPESGPKKDALKQAVAMAASFYHGCLVDGKRGGDRAMDYLARRGISKATVDRFGIGWAPDAWDGVRNEGRRKGFADGVLAAAGLVARSEKTGNFFDMLRARVVLPIKDVRGTVVGFSGRVLDGSEPKYLNTPETSLFNKRSVLFGLYEARDAVLRDKRVVVVEGQLDFITLFQAGFEAAVASQGTAFTPEQAKLLKRYADTVVFAYDADSAGQQATVRSFEALLERELDVRVAVMPAGFDPDKLVRERGIELFLEKVGSAIDLVAFQYDVLRLQHDASTPAGRARIGAALMETVRAAVNPVLRDEYLRRSADVSGIPEETLRIELKRLGKGRPIAPAAPERGRSAQTARNRAERELVALAVNAPPLGRALREQIAPGDLQDADCRELLQAVYTALSESDSVTTDMIMSRIERPTVADLLSEIALAAGALGGQSPGVTDGTVEQLVNKVFEPKRKARLKELKARIDNEAREGAVDPRLIEEYQKLRATMRHWR